MIWNDPWLPDLREPTIQTPQVRGLDKAKVSSLMECDGKIWDEDILNDLFSARDKDLILTVPLSTRDVEDSWFRQLERRGDYIVKSTYRLLQEQRVMFGGNPSPGWALIWKLSILPKVKIFLWRAAADFLPTMLAL